MSTDNKPLLDKEIIRIVKEFVKGLLGNKPTVDKCYMVCSPLSAYLSFLEIENTLTEGEVNEYHHFWITLSDGRIIDPTADQFGLLNIYLKNKPSYYRQYTSDDYNQKINDAIIKFNQQCQTINH